VLAVTGMESVERLRSPRLNSPDSNDTFKKRKLSTEDAGSYNGPDRSPKRSKADDNHDNSKVLPPRDEPRSPPTSTTSSSTNRARPTAASRADALQEEKKRGKRLFGGILGTLGRPAAPSTHQIRRRDIERRQQQEQQQHKQYERAHQQQKTEEDKKLQAGKLAKLKRMREVEQVKFDEHVMRTRHADLLAKARFLRTKSSPSVYYLPWRPTQVQGEVIAKQINDTKELVQREQYDFDRRKDQRMRNLGFEKEKKTPDVDDTRQSKPLASEEEKRLAVGGNIVAEGGPESISQPRAEDIDASRPEVTAPILVPDKDDDPDEAEAGDVMVEDDEDMVIY